MGKVSQEGSRVQALRWEYEETAQQGFEGAERVEEEAELEKYWGLTIGNTPQHHSSPTYRSSLASHLH